MTSFNAERVKKMRVVEIAKFISTKKCTIREAAKKFNISKTTIHKYMVKELPNYSIVLARKVRNVLNCNKQNRHIRGGIATKIKFENLKSKK